ncbi:glycerol-3-phosphate 1-O-acyltransferase PlsY [Natronospora cellulosivora (SeqCode)]
MNILFIMLLSYLIGSIPFAYLVTRLTTGKDVRSVGSGNVGATNAARAMGFKFGLLVGILDILKGVLAVVIARYLLATEATDSLFLLASFLVIIGHNWSIFLKFSGGKGVATSFGVIVTLYPFIFLFLLVIWVLFVLFTRYVSVASIISALSVPILVYLYMGDINNLIFTLVLASLIIIRHSANIKRLFQGNENKMNWPPNLKKGDIR